MNKGILISFTESNNDFDKELREWFVHEHINERALYTPGFFRARIYKSIFKSPKYFATYETTKISDLSSEKYLQKVGNQSNWSKKVIPKLTILDRLTAEITFSKNSGFGGIVSTFRFFPPKELENRNELRESLIKETFPTYIKNHKIISLILAENIPEITNITGNKARLIGGNPTKANNIEWIIIIEGHSKKSMIELCDDIYNFNKFKWLTLADEGRLNLYSLIFGNYKNSK